MQDAKRGAKLNIGPESSDKHSEMVLDAAAQVAAGATVEEAAGYWKYRKLMQQWKEEA